MQTLDLLARASGVLTPHAFAQSYEERLLKAIQPAPGTSFDGSPLSEASGAGVILRPRGEETASFTAAVQDEDHEVGAAIAHRAGVNSIVVDRFEGRYMLSGGADARIAMWDLESGTPAASDGGAAGRVMHRPMGYVTKSDASHRYGITGLSFYPFDSLAFLSSSYDHTLKIYSSTTLAPSATFDLGSVVYAHAMSPIADHLLVACATQHPAVRLVDLRSGATTHSLVGHVGGAVLSVAWSPRDEYILASGGSDGTIRFWDVRRSGANLGVLDMDDSIGVGGYDGEGRGARRRERGRAHAGPVNGVVWTEDGGHVVTAGHDERIRVWSTRTGANTLANFGPIVRNRQVSTRLPVLVPKRLVKPKGDVLFFPNEKEILMYEMFEGVLLKRLKVTGFRQQGPSGDRTSTSKITSLAWRPHNVELFSAHTDGTIRSWQPRTSIDAFVDENEEMEDAPESVEVGNRKRKRQTLQEIHRDLTTRKITFS